MHLRANSTSSSHSKHDWDTSGSMIFSRQWCESLEARWPRNFEPLRRSLLVRGGRDHLDATRSWVPNPARFLTTKPIFFCIGAAAKMHLVLASAPKRSLNYPNTRSSLGT